MQGRLALHQPARWPLSWPRSSNNSEVDDWTPRLLKCKSDPWVGGLKTPRENHMEVRDFLTLFSDIHNIR